MSGDKSKSPTGWDLLVSNFEEMSLAHPPAFVRREAERVFPEFPCVAFATKETDSRAPVSVIGQVAVAGPGRKPSA